MKFTATEDIAAPIETVWARVSNFDGFEGALKGRAREIRRSPDGPATPGTRWTATGTVLGKQRDVEITLDEMTVPTRVCASGGSDGLSVVLDATLESLGPNRTRLTVTSEAKARTMTAKLMLKTASLAQGKMAERYGNRIESFARRIEKSA
ncbi:SRPBCC family protein [Jannaschia sp. M317]|uniref:SRPBCC family protein n=1 Tax=Jannaschia sp. M317 TaxID=2867011 RepID=UPI0021A5ED21|nr:SRPBCC family protein [Jannaschia sp. M317]UWQ18928.1 SRPBCC family protein [Jannaschia sp. M317]